MADPASEERIWVSAEDPFENHNGGTIAFGPDGFLYITLGDSGAADDPLTTRPESRRLVRLDSADRRRSSRRRQTLRNPGRQPGQASQEVRPLGSRGLLHRPAQRLEVQLRPPDRRALGGRRRPEPLGDGPPDRERRQLRLEHQGGLSRLPAAAAPAPDAASKIQPPIVEYPHAPTRDRHDHGLSITGGYVYRGKKLPALAGVYVYGDFDSGRIWGLRIENGKLLTSGELIDMRKNPKLNIASFGEDAQGELYILAFDGRIHELVPRSNAGDRPRSESVKNKNLSPEEIRYIQQGGRSLSWICGAGRS